jgi:hypothetical protein
MMSTVRIPEYVIDLEVYEESGILYTDFTDGGGAAGTYTCKFELPVNFFAERCILTDVTGFANDTSAAVTIGDGSDVDRLNTGTPSVLTTATIIDLGVPSGTRPVITAYKPVITVTGAADFTSINAGAMTIKVWGYMVR